MTDFLVEIGAEELPPKRLRSFARDFHDRVMAALHDAALIETDAASDWFCSPRRLAMRVAGVGEHEPDKVAERLGPKVAAAFDANGAPTKAAEGFARSCGVTVAALGRREDKKGARLAYQQTLSGRPAATVLAEAVTGAVDGMSIPRRMRWGAGEASFARPVHWLVMLHGETVVDCDLFGVRAGRDSRGHRFHHPGAIRLAAPAEYEDRLQKPGRVALDDAAGRLGERLQTMADNAAREAGGRTANRAELARDVAALVEWPTPVVGRFDPEYLALPPDVVIAVLEGQQYYFPLRGSNGELLPRFVAFSNIESRAPEAVRRGNERVVRPRLADAMFFWQNDLKTPLAGRRDALDAVVYQAGLGSLADKAQRVAALAPQIAPAPNIDVRALGRAAALCKCDLVTDMVNEFPELQGVMGGHYAAAGGEPDGVAAAIRQHYLPQQSGDPIPATAYGQRLAIADKLDGIAGIFALGKRPRGAKDPFALRRQAAGIVRIALEAPLPFDLTGAVRAALEPQPVPVQDGDGLGDEIRHFILDRLRSHYDASGVRADVVESVLALDLDDLADVDARIGALAAFVDQPAAQALAAANKRCANILRKSDSEAAAGVDPAGFSESAEVALNDAIEARRDAVDGFVVAADYRAALVELAALREPVDRFFDDVLVMDENPAVRRNRLALLASLHGLFRRTADWARIQVRG